MTQTVIMEASSPLAAMQPQSAHFSSHHWSQSSLDGRMSALGSSSNFNFKELSMKPNHTDYFNIRPSRTASPTSSLAVDLSRNFHIDKSPQPPTPRRSLFSTLNCNIEVLTPPSLSNVTSPNDSMDISPLPHKAPYSAMIMIQAATPLETPTASDEPTLSSPAIIPESPLIALKAQSGIERRQPTITRPTLSRIKGLTTSAVPTTRSAGLDVPPPFKFGNIPFLHPAQQSALEECFVESPEDTSFSSPFHTAMGPTRPKSSHQKTNPFYQVPVNGSPLPCPIKKSTAPAVRPRKQFRRSLSMFEHPADVFNQQQQEQQAETGCLSSVMDIDETQPQLQLPHFIPEEDTLPRITKQTMIDVLDGKYSSSYDNSMVIDCRFEYEYKGGHIDGAINFNNKEELAAKLFDGQVQGKTLLIFHCEYSAHRAPIAAKYIRGEDRNINIHRYPQLTYPEVYILDGGYSSFFKDHKNRCYPQQYVEMNDEKHTTACERGLGKIKQQRAKLGRAATFAFGTHSSQDSPTAPVRTSTVSMMTGMDLSMDLCMDDSPIMKRGSTRRMASF